MNTDKRLKSLDALRGFDMMFIMGFATIVVSICHLFPGGDTCALAQNMEHVAWHGLHHHDTIFPLFLFIAGISFPFSYAKQVAHGASGKQIYLKIFKRTAVLILLGLVINGVLKGDWAHIRFASVLARIGLAWMFAALLYINFKPRARAVIAAVILVGYWLLLKFVPAPDAGPGADPYSFEGNLVGYVDRLLLPGVKWNDSFDPEGILSTLPAIVTAMLGMFTGEFVRLDEKKMSGGRKSAYMLVTAAVITVIGLIWSLDFPINKALWTSTFVLVVGGYSLALFAIFYYIIDVRGWNRWCLFFEVIGLNAITIYVGQSLIPFTNIAKNIVGGIAKTCPPDYGNLLLVIGAFALKWLFLYFLYRKKAFLKV